ncbi:MULTISPECIES: hypothetical protein [unclassified Streptomyces]|nr:hypothetical protein [Streptomyces sp. FIT100]
MPDLIVIGHDDSLLAAHHAFDAVQAPGRPGGRRPRVPLPGTGAR